MTIPGCEIIEKIGQGGMASVYKARQISLDRVVAVKMLLPEWADTDEDVRDFQAEAQAAAKLNHPGIVQVHDAHVEGGQCYIVMEYIAGRSAAQMIADEGPLSEKRALQVAAGVAKALQYAWDRERLIHCDVKPDNIMFDSDGAVKVADLGLARTILAKSQKNSRDEEVKGTPSYMAPEQALGEPDLDCRVDIYALGATLYYLTTGRDMFAGATETQTIQKQIHESAPHPSELNPKLSRPFCALIEKLVARDKADRPAHWEETLKDMARVRKKLLPTRPILAQGVSAVRKPSRMPEARPQPKFRLSARGAPAPGLAAAGAASPSSRRSPAGMILLIVFFAGLIFLLFRARLPTPGDTAADRRVESEALARQEGLDEARAAFESARARERRYPDDFDKIVALYAQAQVLGRDTPYENSARQALRAVRQRKENRAQEILQTLRSRASILVDQDQRLQAAAVYEGYRGLLADETAGPRQVEAERLRAEQAQIEAEHAARLAAIESRFDEVVENTAFRLLTRGASSALAYAQAALAREELGRHETALEAVVQELERAAEAEGHILQWFAARAGQPVQVEIDGEPQRFTVQAVEGNRVLGERPIWRRGRQEMERVPFSVSQLSLDDRLARMGSADQPGVALAKAVMLMEQGQWSQASEFFAHTDSVLGARLRAFRQEERKWADTVAEHDLVAMLQEVGVTVGLYNEERWIELIDRRAKQRPGIVAQLQNAASRFRDRHKETSFFQKAQPVLAHVETGAFEFEPKPEPKPKPESEPKPEPELDPEKRLREAALRAMLTRNPGLFASGIGMETDEQGIVRRVRVVTRGLRNIEPLAALPAVREVVFSGGGSGGHDGRAPLSDIAPLADWPLVKADLSYTEVADLSALRGKRLTELSVNDTPVADLSPLEGMELQSLDVSRTQVRSLAPLTGQPLASVSLAGTRVADLAPLRGMPLRRLDIRDTRVQSLAPLAGMPLRMLYMDGLEVNAQEALSGLPLVFLSANGSNIDDLDVLRDTPLRHLHVNDTAVRDLDPLENLPDLVVLSVSGMRGWARRFRPLAGLSLQRLDVSRTRFHDADLLAGMPLTHLVLAETGVSDLSALRGMPLQDLDIRGTRVSDLEPLRGLPLTRLDCRDTPVADYSPLAALRLHSVHVDDPADPAVRNALARIPTLREVNGRSWAP